MDDRLILGCALNLSDGRRQEVIDLAAGASSAVHVLDISSDADHNRTVLTLCGNPGLLVDAVIEVARVAIEQIDLRQQSGVHPRLGALDVVPFYPLRSAPMEAAVAAARLCARRLWRELGLPVFLYGEAAASESTKALPWIRRNAFAGRFPDLGGRSPHPSAGAAVVGARGLLVAYNVELDTQNPAAARAIAATVRSAHAGMVRTLGLYLPSRALAQVSMNILSPSNFTLAEAFDAVAGEAAKAGIAVLGSEVVGLVPRACLSAAGVKALGLRKTPKVLEEEVDRLFAD
ncbi:MAG TPA: glutamate formimidoyltransferase [Actinomycetota bacterium]|nr:glutamate formimidoyltransferase [Actinomycetota bacterium]